VADVPEEVADQTGDMLAAAAEGVELAGKLVSLADVVAHAGGPPRDRDSLAIYKSVGSALQDVTVSELCLRRARELGLGRGLGQTISPVSK